MELSSEDDVRIVGFIPNPSATITISPSLSSPEQSPPLASTPPWLVNLPPSSSEELSDNGISDTPQPIIQPSVQRAVRAITRPSARSSTRPSSRSSTRPSTRSSARPSTRPSNRALARPSNRTSARTSNRPSGRPSNRPSNGTFSREFSRPSNRPSKPQKVPEIQILCETLTRLSQQLHVLSQRRIAERAAANVPDDGPKPETCPICFDAFHCPGTCATRCGHVFHRKCLDACLKNSYACPVCRAHVHRAELVDLMSGFGEEMGTEDAVVDLIDEPAEERGALDERLLSTLQSVKESIDKSQALDVIVSQAMKEKQEMLANVSSREQELESMKKEFEKVMATERGKLEKREVRIRKGEEMITDKVKELDEKLANVHKEGSELQIQRGEIEAAAEENERMRYELERDKSGMREKERRMKALQEAQKLRKAKEREDCTRERIMTLEQLLRSNGITLPREREREREAELGRDAFKVDWNDDDVREVQSPVKRRKVTTPVEQSLGSAFGSDLKKPSAYSRPPAPRRKGVGVNIFAPERRIVQRPAGVAKRGFNCISRP